MITFTVQITADEAGLENVLHPEDIPGFLYHCQGLLLQDDPVLTLSAKMCPGEYVMVWAAPVVRVVLLGLD